MPSVWYRVLKGHAASEGPGSRFPFVKWGLLFSLESAVISSSDCSRAALRLLVILVPSVSLPLVPAEVMDGGESSRSPGTGCGRTDRRLNFTFGRWTNEGIWSLRLHDSEYLAHFGCAVSFQQILVKTQKWNVCLVCSDCEEPWPYATAGAAWAPFEGTFSSRSKTLIPRSLAVVDGDFRTERILVERLPIEKYMNKTYREALNLNNRKVWTKWSDSHGRLYDYY